MIIIAIKMIAKNQKFNFRTKCDKNILSSLRYNFEHKNVGRSSLIYSRMNLIFYAPINYFHEIYL